MVNLLKLIDIFPQNFILTYKGRKSIKTNWGGIISIFAFFSILFNAILIGKDIYYREKPNVIKVTKQEITTPSFRINEKNIKLGFAFSGEVDIVDDESIMEIIPMYHIQTLNEEKKFIYKEYILEMENCTRTKDDSIYYQKCIKNFDLYLTGSWLENSLAYLNIFFRKCSNKTYFGSSNIKTKEDEKSLDDFVENMNNNNISEYITNKTFNQGLNLYEHLKENERNINKPKKVCRPQADIDDLLKIPHYVNIVYNEINSNPKNNKNSLTSSDKLDYFTVGNDIQKTLQFYYTNYVSKIDAGIIFEEIVIDENKIGISKIDKDLRLSKDLYLASLSFYMSKEVKIINKRYIKLQVIFAELGGFINLTFLILI